MQCPTPILPEAEPTHSATAHGLTLLHLPRSSCPGELHAVLRVKGGQIGQKQMGWHWFYRIPETWEVVCPCPVLICRQDQDWPGLISLWFQMHLGIWSSHKKWGCLTLGPWDPSHIHILEKRLPCAPGDTARDVPSSGDHNRTLDEQGVSQAHSGTLYSLEN